MGAVSEVEEKEGRVGMGKAEGGLEDGDEAGERQGEVEMEAEGAGAGVGKAALGRREAEVEEEGGRGAMGGGERPAGLPAEMAVAAVVREDGGHRTWWRRGSLHLPERTEEGDQSHRPA